MTHEAVLEFDYPDSASARAVADSVAVEAGDIEGDRSRATVERAGATVTVTVAAADLVALRAGCNTWLSLVGVAESCAGATGHRSGAGGGEDGNADTGRGGDGDTDTDGSEDADTDS